MTNQSPLDAIVPDWTARPFPERVVHAGSRVQLEPLNPSKHEDGLWKAAQAANQVEGFWNYLSYGPYTDRDVFHHDMVTNAASPDPLFFSVVDVRTGKASGVASIMRIDAANGVAEVGHIWFGPSLQRTAAATEAIFLVGEYLFTELGYRRFEWKCHALNAPSRRAAARFGFTYEGTFRQHSVSRGRNRDTAWFAMIDSEWPAIRAGFVAWLDRSNFDEDGRQVRSLEECRASATG